MSDEKTTTLPSWLRETVVRESATRDVMLVLLGSVVIALSAQVALPIHPVPVTMQPVAILLVGAALGSKRGAFAALLYLLEGLGGLPVFANASFGPAVFAGPTAGYLFAFPAAAFVSGWVSEHEWGSSLRLTIAGMTVALATIHLGGWSWLATVWGLGASKAFAAGVLPFLLGDIVKLSIAATALPLAQHFVGNRPLGE